MTLDQARAAATYALRLKDGSIWYLDADGGVLWDGSRGMGWEAPHTSWRITGFTTRHMGHYQITLDRAAQGEALGQGWVHDLDGGTHRMWCMPSLHRAVSVSRLRDRR